MKPTILFLEQQSWRAGAQRVLEVVLDALRGDFTPVVALPDDGPFAADLRGRGIETVVYPLGRYRPGPKSYGEMMAFAARSVRCGIRLARLIRRRKILLVYVNGPRALPAGVLAARLTRSPVLFHLHRALTRQSDLFVTSKAAAHASKIVACSQAAAATLTAAAPRLEPITQVLYNPSLVEGTRQSPSASGAVASDVGGPVVGLVGRITPQKGQMVLLRAAARLKDRWPDLRVVFVGDAESGNTRDAAYLKELVATVTELGLGKHVHFAGYQSDPIPFYARFDVLAMPSIDTGEGLPMVVLEAAAQGVPVVASKVGGMPEVIRDGWSGLLVAPGDDRALAEGLARVLADATLRARVASGARQILEERFSPEVFRRTICAAVSELVLPQRSPRMQGAIEAHG
jgi:glycosyltransferase involved in cell wall biosynthesis